MKHYSTIHIKNIEVGIRVRQLFTRIDVVAKLYISRSLSDADELLRYLSRVQLELSAIELAPSPTTSPATSSSTDLGTLSSLIDQAEFRRLLALNNRVEAMLCFQCPPRALCSDAMSLAHEVLCSLTSTL
jgi:hypothetical protein